MYARNVISKHVSIIFVEYHSIYITWCVANVIIEKMLTKYVLVKLNFVACIFVFCLRYCKSQYCPTQTSTHQGTLVVWFSQESTEVISSPPCINNHYELTKRKCTEDRRWNPPDPPQCRLVQQRFQPSCPPNFITIENYCIFVSSPQPWKPKCPFPDSQLLVKPQHLELISRLGLAEIWLPVTRFQRFGKFFWVWPRKYGVPYGHEYLKKVELENQIRDCIVVSNIHRAGSYEIKVVSCNSLYRQVCVYNINSTFSASTNAVACSSYKNTCYSLITSGATRNSCLKPAEPKTQIENYVIKGLVQENACWIGLQRYSNSFQWSDNSSLKYTDWKTSTDFNKPFVGLSKNGWNLFDDHRLNCTVCEIDHTTQDINLVLRPHFKYNLLILTVYSPSYFIQKISCRAIGLEKVDFDIEKVNINSLDESASIKDDREIYLIEPSTKEFNYYECRGVVLPNESVIATETVLLGKKHGREYAARIVIEDICRFSKNCTMPLENLFGEILKKLDHDFFDHLRVMKVLGLKNQSLEMILHIRAEKNPLPILKEYKLVHKILDTILCQQIFLSTSLISLRSSIGCLDYSEDQNWTLSWEFTKTGEVTTPKEICLDTFGLPVTKKCGGDFINGGHWLEQSGDCSQDANISEATTKLHAALINISTLNSEETIDLLFNLTKSNLIPNYIYYIAKILNNFPFVNVSNSTYLAEKIVGTLSNLVGASNNSLKLSNLLLNSTNMLLDIFENLMEGFEDLELNEGGIIQFVTPNIYYQISDLSVNNISGIALLGSQRKDLEDYDFQVLTSETNLEDLLQKKDLEIATYIPNAIIERIKNESNITKVFITVFQNHSLFVEDEESNNTIHNKIISVSLLGYDFLSTPIPVIFRSDLNYNQFHCSYWSFGRNSYQQKYPTKWAQDGGMRYKTSNGLEVCAFTHLTHFALLLGEPQITADETPDYEYHDEILSIITTIGCTLSIFGIGGILLTAILFRSWRQKSGTKVLLNLSVSTALTMVVLFFADSKNMPINSTRCIILGALLHYATISSFCWMLVVAFLQYLRFIRVVGGTPSRLLLKSCIIGWGLPLLPVVILLIWDPANYTPIAANKTLCYPQGNTIYTTVLLPIIVIIIFNLSIFCLVLYNVTRKSVPKRSNNKNLTGHQLNLAFLLFFLLGLTWIFGLITAVSKSLLFLYLFCSTATTQGFVLFLFYVLLDSNTRKLWTALLLPYLKIPPRKLNRKLTNSNITLDARQNTSETSTDNVNTTSN